MEMFKNYVFRDTGLHWDDNENFKAIPDGYKSLRIYTTHARVEGAIEKMRDLNWQYSPDDTLSVIGEEVHEMCGWYDDEAKDKNQELIIKWLFEMFEDGYIYDVETGEYSRLDDEEEEEDSDHSC